MATGRLTTLGAFTLEIDGITLTMPTIQKARAMLAFLALHRDGDISRERLIELFWPEADPQRSHDNLKTTLWAIRRCFRNSGLDPDGFISATRLVVRWCAPLSVDAEEFANTAAGERSDDQAALKLYKGDFLEGVSEEWAVSERERLAVIYESLLARSLERSSDVAVAQRMIDRNPYHEPAYAALIDAELTADRYVAAMSVVARCRAALAEVGAQPSSQFEARYGAIEAPARPHETTPTVRFVGREPELEAIDGVFARAANGMGSVLLVVGDAGIGKSSILSQAHALAGARNVTVFTVRCVESDAGAYGPWPRLYAQVSRVDFKQLVVGGATDAAISCAAAVAAAAQGRAALVVDNVHALRAEGLAMLAAISGELSRLGHAVIAALRPEGLQAVHAALHGIPLDEVEVLPLGRAQVDDLVRHLMQEEADTLAGPLYDRTQGHPLFIVGILDSLARSGAIRHEARGWRLAQSIDHRLDLPPTLRRYVETRLRSRGEDAAGVACALSLEPDATADDVADALDLDEMRTFDGLDDLLELGILRQPPVGPQFEFCHDVFREVAETLLNAGRRTRIHARLAERLAKSSASDKSLRRARHLAIAGDRLAAAVAFEEATWDAMQFSAWQEAADRARQGLAQLGGVTAGIQRDRIAGSLLRRIANALMHLGEIEAGITAATDALEHTRAAGDDQLHAETLLTRVHGFGAACRDLEQAAADAVEAAEITARLGDRLTESRALFLAAWQYRLLGHRSEALEGARRAYDAAARINHWPVASAALDALLRAQITWWQFGDAVETCALYRLSARRAGRLAEMEFTRTRLFLWYALERYSDVRRELETIEQYLGSGEAKLDSGGVEAGSAVWNFELDSFFMRAMLASVDAQWDVVIEHARALGRLRGLAASARIENNIAHTLIDGLLGRAAPGDIDEAATAAARLVPILFVPNLIGWSRCDELSRARVAAAMHRTDARPLLDRAFETVEKNAERTPLDADLAFERLALAAATSGYKAMKSKAQARCDYYREKRRVAALEFSSRVFSDVV